MDTRTERIIVRLKETGKPVSIQRRWFHPNVHEFMDKPEPKKEEEVVEETEETAEEVVEEEEAVEEPAPQVCGICSKEYKTMAGLKGHKTKAHPDAK